MLNRHEEKEVEAIMYIQGLDNYAELLADRLGCSTRYGNIFGAAVYAAIEHQDLEGVQRFLPDVPVGHYADKLFTCYMITPEIMAYILQNKPISELARNIALRVAVTINNVDTIKLLLAQSGVHVLHPEHRKLPLVQQATFNIQPELVQLLVQHLVENSTGNQHNAVLDEALIILADNDAFYRVLCHSMKEEKERLVTRIVSNNEKVLKIAEILIKNGANVNARDAQGSVIQHAEQRVHLRSFVAYLKWHQPAVSPASSTASLFSPAAAIMVSDAASNYPHPTWTD